VGHPADAATFSCLAIHPTSKLVGILVVVVKAKISLKSG
jgi:hypothetical protein